MSQTILFGHDGGRTQSIDCRTIDGFVDSACEMRTLQHPACESRTAPVVSAMYAPEGTMETTLTLYLRGGVGFLTLPEEGDADTLRQKVSNELDMLGLGRLCEVRFGRLVVQDNLITLCSGGEVEYVYTVDGERCEDVTMADVTNETVSFIGGRFRVETPTGQTVVDVKLPEQGSLPWFECPTATAEETRYLQEGFLGAFNRLSHE